MEEENVIKKYLDLTELSYEEAAQRTGLTKQAIWLHATGKTRLSAKAFYIYHKAFGISYEKLAEISYSKTN